MFVCLIWLVGNRTLHAFDIEVYENKTYVDNIKTVQLFPKNYSLASPITQLNSGEIMVLAFDDLSNERKDYYYSIIQCTFDWKPTDVFTNDYLKGFSEGSITDYDFSSGTLVPYIHYRLEIPNLDMTITKSGNYAIVVYENSPDNIIFTKRMMVYESIAQVEGYITAPRLVTGFDDFQQVQFTVNHKGLAIENAYQEVNAIVIQNDRPDNTVSGVQPLFVKDQDLQFTHNRILDFPSGKEFRRVDIRTDRFKGDGILNAEVLDSFTNYYTFTGTIRSNIAHKQERDFNGKYYVDKQERWRDDYEADYGWVYFSLAMDKPVSNANVYIYGGFNDWQITDANKMSYDVGTGMYNGKILLKQGYYNYQYVVVDEEQQIIDQSLTEGNYYDTENDYTILIYYRPFTERYDRLIGVEFLNSKTNRF